MNHTKIEEIAAKASEAFFAEVFKHFPDGTSGDFPPDATMIWEQATEMAVRTLALNIPQKKYFVLYEVEWSATSEDEDAPMDFAHSLGVTDDRITTHGMIAIGDREEIFAVLSEEEK